MRHFLTLKDFTKDEILEMITLAQQIKTETKAKKFVPYMEKQTLGMIFEKSSTRTRVSFETGIYQLGGIGLFLSSNDIQLGRGEPMKDTARVISRMVDMVMIRTFEQSNIEEFAHYSKVPVINGLTDSYHPVQLMTDYLTILEFKKDIFDIEGRSRPFLTIGILNLARKPRPFLSSVTAHVLNIKPNFITTSITLRCSKR